MKKIEEKYLPLDFDSIQKENCFERYSLYSEVVELENGELIYEQRLDRIK